MVSLFLALAIALQLFLELTEQEVTTGATALFTIEADTVKKEGYVTYFSVSDASVPFDFFAYNCMYNTQGSVICYDCWSSSRFVV